MAFIKRATLGKMKPGSVMVIKWNVPREFRCVRAACSDVTHNYPEYNLRMETELNREDKTITVRAFSSTEPKEMEG